MKRSSNSGNGQQGDLAYVAPDGLTCSRYVHAAAWAPFSNTIHRSTPHTIEQNIGIL